MTRESSDIHRSLKERKEFSTRFQEEEWGLRFLGGDNFQKRDHRAVLFTNDKGETDGRDENGEETLNEQQVIELMMKSYSYPVMIEKLK